MEPNAPVDPSLMPVDLTAVSMRAFDVAKSPATEEIMLRQAA